MSVEAPAGTVESRNPSSGELIGTVPVTPAERIELLVEEVAGVQPFWSLLRAEDRARYLRRTARIIAAEQEEIRDLIAREQGRPRTEAAFMEVLPSIEALRWAADEGPKLMADRRLRLPRALFPLTRAHADADPVGVVGVIAPGSRPWSMPASALALALVAGNGVVLKPSPRAPLLADRLVSAFSRAGLPEGLVRVAHGEAATGRALVESSTGAVLFAGGLSVGREVAAERPGRLRRAALEVGGADPMLVLADAHVPRVLDGALWAAFANAGQGSGAAKRLLVLPEVAERVIEGLVEGASRLEVGDPMRWETVVGPLASAERLERVEAMVEEAVAAGAVRRCGGAMRPAGLAGSFCAPIVVTGATPEMRLMREPAPGPVLAVMQVEDEEHAIAVANDGASGLGASVWTEDRPKGTRIARRLESGMVWLNDHGASHAAPGTPWGGARGRGLGRIQGAHALLACVEPKLVTWDPPRGRQLWWPPYSERMGRAASAIGLLRSTREADRERAVREGGVALVREGWRGLRSLGRR